MQPLKIPNRLRPFLLPALAALLLFGGVWQYGLTDPWEMNRTHMAQLVASKARVVLIGSPGADALEPLQERLSGAMELNDFSERKSSSFVGAMTKPRALLRTTLVHVVALLPDSLLKEDEGADTVAEQVRRLKSENPGLAVVIATDDHLVDDEALRSVGADDVVPVAGSADAILAHADASRWRVQFRQGGKSSSIPVLDTWLVAASFRAFGFHEASARLPYVVMGFLLLLLIVGIARRLGQDRSLGDIAGLVLLTTPIFLLSARSLNSGLSASLFLVATLWPLVNSAERKPGARDLALFVLALVGGFLARGLSFPLIITLSTGAWFLVGRVDRARSLPFALVSLALLLLGVALVFLPEGWTFFDHFRFMERPFLGGVKALDRNFDFFVSRVGFGMLPWAAFVPFALAYLIMGTPGRGTDSPSYSDDKGQAVDVLIAVWFLIPFVVGMAMLPHFGHGSFIAYPILALAIARYLSAVAEDPALRGRFVAFLAFAILVIVATQIKSSPLHLLNTLLVDPPLAAEKGDYKLPPDLVFGKGGRITLLLFGLLIAHVFARGWTRGRSFILAARRRDLARFAVAAVLLLVLADAFISGMLRVNTTVLSKQAATLSHELRRFPFIHFGARFESILSYVFAGALALAWPLTLLYGRLRRGSSAGTPRALPVLIPARFEAAALAAASGAFLLTALIGLAQKGLAPGALVLHSAGLWAWLGLLGSFGLLLAFTRPASFARDGAFPWLGSFAAPGVLGRLILGIAAFGLFYLAAAICRAAGINGAALWVPASVGLAILLTLALPWATRSGSTYALGLLLALIGFGLLNVPLVIETWGHISAALYPEVNSSYAKEVFVKSNDVRVLWLLLGLVIGNALWPRRAAMALALRRRQVFLGALAPVLLVLVLGASLKLGLVSAFDASFARALGLILLGGSGLTLLALLLAHVNALSMIARLLRHELLASASLVGAVAALVIGVLGPLPVMWFVSGALGLFWVLRRVIGDDDPGVLVERLERPRYAALLGGLLLIAFSVQAAHDVLPRFAAQFSQKHILDTYLSVEGRSDLGENIFKHGSFAKKDREDINFYTNTVPEISDRKNVLKALSASEDVGVKLGFSRPVGRPEHVVLRGWDPANDKDKDGTRDAAATAGIASYATEGRLQDESATWTPGAWAGAKLYDSGNKGFAISANSADSLTLEGTPNFLAYNPLFNSYRIDAGAELNHKATAMTPPSYYFIFPKRSFAELNHAFRKANKGRFIPLLDDRSDYFLLASNRLPSADGIEDRNWLRRAVVTEEEFAADSRIKRGYAKYEDFMEFIGFRMGQESVTRGTEAEINLYYRIIGGTRTSWKVFMHVDRPGSRNRINGDHWPHNLIRETENNKNCEGCFKTTQWMKGDIVVDTYRLEVPVGTPSGTQEVWTGFYNPSGDKRLKVVDHDKKLTAHDGGNRIKAGTFIIP